jgi:MFS transporter, ACS family, D-galactonate transporter
MNATTSSERNQTSAWGAWRIVALLVAFSFMSWFNRVSMAVAYDTRIGPDHNVSEEAIGTVYSAFFLSYLLFMTPGGWFIDRFGAKRALLVMGLGSGLFGAMTYCAGLPSLQAAGLLVTALLCIRFCMGLVSAPLYPAATRMVSYWVPLHQRVFANGLVQGAAALGMACAFPLFGALIDAWNWPAAFLASGTLTTILGLVWWVYAADRPPRRVPERQSAVRAGEPPSYSLAEDQIHQGERTAQIRAIQELQGLHSESGSSRHRDLSQDEDAAALPPSQAHWFALFLNRNVLLLTLSYAAVGYLEYLFFFWMNHYFDKILHVEKHRSRIFTAILFLSLAAGMVAGGWLTDRLRKSFGPWIGRALVPMGGMTLGAVFLGFGVLGEQIGWIVFWLALALMAVGATEAPIWTAAVEVGGRQGGTAAGIVNTGGNLGGFIAPFLTPRVSHAVRDGFGLSDQAGWQWGITLAGVLCLSGATLWWWIRPEQSAARA